MKKINLRNLIFNIIFVLLIISTVGYLFKYKIISDKLKKVQAENNLLEEQIVKLKTDIEFAKSIEFVEKTAREKFDMIKDGELIIILEEK
ncbi:MAG: septum formation initiator family protein [Caldisericia bacterium]|nr:septum formation initiator family protein [Caldisericia bacterium]